MTKSDNVVALINRNATSVEIIILGQDYITGDKLLENIWNVSFSDFSQVSPILVSKDLSEN